MGRGNRKGDKRGARSGVTVHGKFNQSFGHVVIVKCQNSQVLGTSVRDKRDSLGPNLTA